MCSYTWEIGEKMQPPNLPVIDVCLLFPSLFTGIFLSSAVQAHNLLWSPPTEHKSQRSQEKLWKFRECQFNQMVSNLNDFLKMRANVVILCSRAKMHKSNFNTS